MSAQRLILVAVLGFVLGFSPVHAAMGDIFLDAVSSARTAGNATALTVGHTVANNPNRFLVVGLVIGDTVTTTSGASVLYAGRPLMFLGRSGLNTTSMVELWGLVAPPVGTANVVATLQGAAGFGASIGVVAATYYNVSQVDPTGSFAGNTGTSTAPSVTVVPPEIPREGIFGIVTWNAASNLTATGAQQNPLIGAPLVSLTDNSQEFTASDMPEAGGATMTWTLNASTAWRTAAIGLKPFTATENASQLGVQLDNFATTASTVAVNSLTLTGFTVANNANRGMIVGIAYGDSTNSTVITNVTYGGTGMTFLGIEGAGTTRKVELWGMLAPAIGTANVVVTMTAGRTGSLGFTVASYWNIDQTTPANAFSSTQGTSTAPNVTVPPAVSDRQVIFDVIACVNTSNVIATGALQTPLQVVPTFATGDQNLDFTCSSKQHFGSTMQWTLSASTTWRHAAISINPVPITPALDQVEIGLSASVSSGTPADANSRTVALTVANDPDRLLVVGIAATDNSVSAATVASVTYGGTPLTFQGRQFDGQTRRMVEIWTLVAPPVGTANVVATLGVGLNGGIGIVAASFFNVNQAAPVGSFVGTEGNNGAPTVDVGAPETSRELVFDIVAKNGSLTAVGADQTALAPVNPALNALSTNGVAFSGSYQLHDTSNTMSWAGNNGRWASAAIPLRPQKALATAVRYVKARAFAQGGGVRVKWKTGYEKDNLGFRVWREDASGRTLVTPDMIAGSALFVSSRRMAMGRSYHVDDATPGDATARYFIEDRDLHGKKTWYGPIAVEAGAAAARAAREPSDPARTLRSLVVRGRGRRASRQAGPVGTGGGVASRSAAQLSLSGAPAAAMNLAPYLLGAQPTAANASAQVALAGRAAVKITVNGPGWYALDRDQLVAAGLPADVSPKALSIFTGGSEVAITVRSASTTRFDSGDRVEFFGTGQDTLQTDSRVYYLTWNAILGRRIARSVATGNGSAGAASFPYAVERHDRNFYLANVHNGDTDNFYGPIVLGTAVDQIIDVPHPDTVSGGQATVSVSLQGLAGEHAVAVALNGHALGVLMFSGDNSGVASYTVPAAWLQDGDNTLRLTGASDEDITAVENLRIDYPHRYVADNGALIFTAQPGAAQVVSGFDSSALRLIDITDPAVPRELDVRVIPSGGGHAVSFTAIGTGTRTLLAFASDVLALPLSLKPNVPSTLSAGTNTGALVMIAHARFAAALEPLRARRAAQLGSAKIVDVEDIYDEFSYGAKSSQAIRDFLAKASSWAKPPGYVLLVGDATFNPRNYTQEGLEDIDFDYVPVRIVDTLELETASDDWYTDANGDGAADLPIGRFPVRTAEETSAIVTKLLAYEDAPADPSWTRRAVLVADHATPEHDFPASAASTATVFPQTYTVSTISLDEVGSGSARSQLLDAINAGAGLVVYFGHSSQEQWSDPGIFFGDDAASLTAGTRLPVVVSMTCLTGLFQDLFVDCMAKDALRAPQGPVAMWASTGFCEPSTQPGLARNFLSQLVGAQPRTLGEAAVVAKRGIQDRGARVTWTLFGDPSMRMR